MIRAVVFGVAISAVLALPSSARAALLTTGVLTDAMGSPTAGQVRLYAFRLPGASGVTESPQIGVAQAGSDGRFAVSAADEARVVRLARARGGWLDVTAVADTPGRQAQWSFTVYVDAPAGAARVTSSDAAIAKAAASSTRAPHISLRADRPVPFAQASQAGRCDTKLRTRDPESVRKLAVVGELNNAYNDGTRGTFTYARSRTAETWFGIAAVVGHATPTVGGENLISNSGSAKFPPAKKRYSRRLRTLFEFTRYQTQSSSCAAWETEIRATSWIGGTDSTVKQNGLNKCDPRHLGDGWEGGGRFSRISGTAVRYVRAVEAFGVNLTSRSGFSRDVTLDYTFGGPLTKKHWLCGSDGKQSPFESGRVFSGARR